MSALDELQAVMFKWKERNSVIKPTLHRRANGPNYWYRLQLVEETDDEYVKYPGLTLDYCVKWVESQLKDWSDCHRKAWDMWDFKHRRDAEKFITLFHLLWEQ
jgi:hypothetical protein